MLLEFSRFAHVGAGDFMLSSHRGCRTGVRKFEVNMSGYRHSACDTLQCFLRFWSHGVWLKSRPRQVDGSKKKENAAGRRHHPEFCSRGVGSTIGNRNDSTGIITHRCRQRGNLHQIYLPAGAAISPIDISRVGCDHNAGGPFFYWGRAGPVRRRRRTGPRVYSICVGWHQYSAIHLPLLEAEPAMRFGWTGDGR